MITRKAEATKLRKDAESWDAGKGPLNRSAPPRYHAMMLTGHNDFFEDQEVVIACLLAAEVIESGDWNQ